LQPRMAEDTWIRCPDPSLMGLDCNQTQGSWVFYLFGTQSS
jgi:hypothetical protein